MKAEEYKSGYVALIGRPNVGKSTLMNTLIGQKIAITSNKPQTTRNRIQTVYTDERGQIIFLDTPGVHKAKNRLGDYMVKVAEGTLKDVDLVLWLVEPSTHIGKGDQIILEKLKEIDKPVFLLINKLDTIPKAEVLPVMDTYRKLMDFAEIIPVSALKRYNMDDLLATIFKYLKPGPQYYDEDTVTDQPMRQIVAELIREKALYSLQEEIPHGIAVLIDSMKKRNNRIWDISATIVCEKESHKGIIIGKDGDMLKKIGSAARYEIEDQLGAKVNLELWVKVRSQWRDNEKLLRSFGYRKEDERPHKSQGNGALSFTDR
jgi:GTP-binding protein Era